MVVALNAGSVCFHASAFFAQFEDKRDHFLICYTGIFHGLSFVCSYFEGLLDFFLARDQRMFIAARACSLERALAAPVPAFPPRRPRAIAWGFFIVLLG
jgi:hypothetical protein